MNLWLSAALSGCSFGVLLGAWFQRIQDRARARGEKGIAPVNAIWKLLLHPTFALAISCLALGVALGQASMSR